MLFAPAARADLLAKLPRAGADAVVLDCEDGTAAGRKAEARTIARTVGADLVAAGQQVWVRVNGADTGWFADDVASALPPGAAGVVLPVAERLSQLDDLADRLAEAGHPGLPVLAGLETALGVADARLLLAHPSVAAGYFGAEDFVADVGGERTPGNAEVAYARAAVALAGRLAGVPVLDQVVVAFADDERFTREAGEARALGYAGKLCIHPAQVPLAHAAFTPSAEAVAAAQRVLDAAAAGAASGEGVVVVDGRMVDGPLIAQARRVVESAG
jgi:citrate lyase subunit beta/citryl-CoA lyase